MKCAIENCNCINAHMSDEFNMLLCSKHYTQLKRYKKILFRTKFDSNEINIISDEGYAEMSLYDIKNNKKALTKIDIDDVEKCEKYKWCLDRGYATTKIKGKKVYLHRFIMNCSDPNFIVNHISKLNKKNDSLDNRKKFLEIIPEVKNSQNLSLSKLNSSGHTGTSFRGDRKLWESYITLYGRRKHLGLFDNIDDALLMRLKTEKKYGIKTQAYLFSSFEIDDNTDLSCIPNIDTKNFYRDKISVKFANDRAKGKGAKADLTLEQFIQIKEYFRDNDGILRCPFCNCALSNDNEVIDHVRPIIKGGESTKSNVISCCRNCNQDKMIKDVYEWYKQKKFYSVDRYNKLIELMSNTNKYVDDNIVYDVFIFESKLKYFKAEHENGDEFISNNQTLFAKEHNLSQPRISSCLKNSKIYNGFKFTFLSFDEIVQYLKSKGKVVLTLPKCYY